MAPYATLPYARASKAHRPTTKPSKLTSGPKVLQQLALEFLMGWSDRDRPPHLQQVLQSGVVTPQRTEVVILSQAPSPLQAPRSTGGTVFYGNFAKLHPYFKRCASGTL